MFLSCDQWLFQSCDQILKLMILALLIFRDLPKESHSQMAVDTSRVETSLAESTAYIDTATNMINHSIKNKVDSMDQEQKYVFR